jgi:hypothetical protein
MNSLAVIGFVLFFAFKRGVPVRPSSISFQDVNSMLGQLPEIQVRIWVLGWINTNKLRCNSPEESSPPTLNVGGGNFVEMNVIR